MELTVLGCYGPFPGPKTACSGYLLKAGETTLVLDLGPGTLSRLVDVLPKLDMDAVILSHLHADHYSDMLALRYALDQYSEAGKNVRIPLSVISPGEPREDYRMLAASGIYDMVPADDNLKATIKDVVLTFNRMSHPVPSYSVTVEHKGKKFVYSGDTGMRYNIEDVWANADFVLADTNYLNEEATGAMAPHLSAGQAGEIAAKANVKKLVCTNFRGAFCNKEKLLTQVRSKFPSAELAEEGKHYNI